MVAQKLGIPFYNREILQMASERCNVSPEYLETAEEAAPKSFLYTLMLTSSPTHTIEENLPLSDKVYIIETNIIRELAEKSDCVIVGRCASYILREMQNLFNVFIYADLKTRSKKSSRSVPSRPIMWRHGVWRQCFARSTSAVKRSTASTPAETGMTSRTTTCA